MRVQLNIVSFPPQKFEINVVQTADLVHELFVPLGVSVVIYQIYFINQCTCMICVVGMVSGKCI
jgi:hypothetical protein